MRDKGNNLASGIPSNKEGQPLIHKAENLLDIICDNFDYPLFVARGFKEFQKRIQLLPHNHIYKKLKKIEWKSRP